MTPKQKAKQLVDKFISYSYFSNGNNAMNRQYQQEDNAKQCALIAVDELIKYAKTFGDVTELDIQHFEDIKKEIELL
jgi:hypothetical protein